MTDTARSGAVAPGLPPHRFRALADDLEAGIRRGDYRVGDRLPSVRTLHVERGLATGTVMQALAELEGRGLVEARPRAGYFVKARRELVVPQTESRDLEPRNVPLPHLVDAFVAASADGKLVPLGGTVLAERVVPVRHLQRIGREVLSRDASVFTSYGPPAGDLELRRLIRRRLVTIGVHAGIDDVVITSGAMNAMRLAIGTMAKPGDTVVIESPTFFALLPMLRDAGLLVVEIATDPSSGIDLTALGSVAGRRPIAAVVVTPSFHNPTGACMSTSRKQELRSLSREHGFAIIEDDVYGDLYFGPRRPRPLAALTDGDDDVFYCSSFSKTLAAGLRVGFVVNRRRGPALARAKLSTTMSSPVFNQRVIARFLASGAYDRHLRRLREALRRHVADATQSIARNWPAEVEVTSPAGGFFLWIRLPAGVDGVTLHAHAMREGIAILPGAVCAIDDRYARYIRISCGHPWSEAMEAALARLGTMMVARRA